MMATETILNTFPWRRTDELTLYNTQNFDTPTLQAIIDDFVKKGYYLPNPINL